MISLFEDANIWGVLGKAYPPKGENGLRSLHQQVCENKVSAHHKLSVFYYLLLDYDGVRGSKSQLAEDFAIRSGLPKKYQILMRGLWHMDRKEFKARATTTTMTLPQVANTFTF